MHFSIALCQTEASAVAEKMTIPVPEGVDKPVSAKIDKIANDISALNLIEVAELSDVLKKRLNLPDAPVMPMGGFQVASQVRMTNSYLIKLKFGKLFITPNILFCRKKMRKKLPKAYKLHFKLNL